MAKVAKLLSTSLFMTLDEIATGEVCTADSDYIMKLRDDMTDSLSKHFEGKDRIIVRSMMSKLLSSMPIFMNSQQEISDYFNYVLTNSVDASEMTAVNNLLEELMMDV